jgi:sulfoxide reductase heme-binding subunit YedZ
MMKRLLSKRWIKAPVFVLCLAPAMWLAWRGLHDQLGANPIELITHATGDWTIRFLLITLAITPLRKLLGWPELIRYRRMLGLFAFFYGSLHLMTYLWLDKFFEWREILADVGKRPFITAGFLAFVLIVPLAVTSTAGWIRRLGGSRWRLLHRLIYVSAAAGVIHYWWLVKSDIREPLLYGCIGGVLLAYRGGSSLLSYFHVRRASGVLERGSGAGEGSPLEGGRHPGRRLAAQTGGGDRTVPDPFANRRRD